MVFKKGNNIKEYSRNRSFWPLVFLLLFLILASAYLYIYSILNINTIYPNIFIDGTDVGGLTQNEAVLLLQENLDKTYLNDYITLVVPKRQYKLFFSDIEYLPAYEKAVALAYSEGRTGNFIQRLDRICKIRKHGMQITPQMCYNIEKTTKILKSIRKEIDIKPKNAEIKISNDKIEIFPHETGCLMDVSLSLDRIQKSLIQRTWNDIDLCVVELIPDITTQMIDKITYKLGEFYTTFNLANEPRVHNIKTACSKINQKLLIAEEEFSMDKLLGNRTEDNGYKQAKVIINNELVDGLGGGICQVTSTVYNSVLLSGLEILERRNHTIPSTYIEVGRDATISQGYIDFRFRNNSSYAVIVEAKVTGNKVIVAIWGCEPQVKTKVRIRTKVIEEIEAQGVEEVTDKFLKAGEIVVLREAIPGCKVEVYKDTFDMSGNIIKIEKISVDTYQPQKRKIKVGVNSNEMDNASKAP